MQICHYHVSCSLSSLSSVLLLRQTNYSAPFPQLYLSREKANEATTNRQCAGSSSVLDDNQQQLIVLFAFSCLHFFVLCVFASLHLILSLSLCVCASVFLFSYFIHGDGGVSSFFSSSSSSSPFSLASSLFDLSQLKHKERDEIEREMKKWKEEDKNINITQMR